jgi:hypothetical protein
MDGEGGGDAENGGKGLQPMKSTTNGKTVHFSDKSPGTQRAIRWFFRILYGWILLAFTVMAVMFMADFLNLL